jgi:alkanesulfonate monooxygenase
MLADFSHFQGLHFYTSGSSDVSRTRDIAKWSEECGFRGMLLYTDNRTLDAWVLGQHVLFGTTRLSPLIAVQPVYMHPFATAQKILALTCLYGRTVDLNLVAGGFGLDLAGLNDRAEHDDRYERLAEYGLIVMKLLTGENVTFKGRFYSLNGVKLNSSVPVDLRPHLTVAGSSPAGRKCATVLGATPIEYPEPLDVTSLSCERSMGLTIVDNCNKGIRIGILARETTQSAWDRAKKWLPDVSTDKSRLTSAVSVTDSSWLRRLSDVALSVRTDPPDVYWLRPFEMGVSFCPYLVGSYGDVARYLCAYVNTGVRVIILDTPREKEELEHTYVAMTETVSKA